MPYLIAGRFQLWGDSVICAGIAFSSSHRSYENLFDLFGIGFGVYPDGTVIYSSLLLGMVIWMGGFVGMLRCAYNWNRCEKVTLNRVMVTGLFLVSAMMSVGMTGPSYGHYLVQLVPWFAIFLGVAVTARLTRVWSLLSAMGIGVMLVVSAFESTYGSYYVLLERLKHGKSLAYGAAYEIADYLRPEGARGRSVYMVDDPLVYWLLGAYSPTRLSTHPYNIIRPELVRAIEGPNGTPELEMEKIIQTRPNYIVEPQSAQYLNRWPEVRRLLDGALAHDYTLITVIEGRQIYRRNSIEMP